MPGETDLHKTLKKEACRWLYRMGYRCIAAEVRLKPLGIIDAVGTGVFRPYNNYLFIPGYVLTLLSKTPTTATCADVPGAVDYVLTPSDISAINARMAQINARIQAVAAENGYAYFALSALYDQPKINFDMYAVMFSRDPFGPNMSLDGVHPSAQGQSILANAARLAINEKYGLAIP